MPTIEQLEAQVTGMGLRLIEKPLPNDMGQYDARTRTITLHERLNNRQRLCTLQHELIHAEHHRDGLMILGRGKEENLTRRQTAKRLITMRDYASVELMCDGEPWRMAAELGVTPDVLTDFQNLLHDGMLSAVRG